MNRGNGRGSFPIKQNRCLKRKCLAPLFILISHTIGAQDAKATLYASNLDTTVDFQYLVGNIGASPLSVANEFTTGSHPAGYQVSEISIRFNTTYQTPADLLIAIYDSEATFPSALVGSLSGENPTTVGVYHYAPDTTPLTLKSSTSYFLILHPESVQPTSAYYFPAMTLSPNESSLEGWTLSDSYSQSSNLGTTWSHQAGSLQFSIEATPVPEPDFYVILAALPLLWFSWQHRRRTKDSSTSATTDP